MKFVEGGGFQADVDAVLVCHSEQALLNPSFDPDGCLWILMDLWGPLYLRSFYVCAPRALDKSRTILDTGTL
jgi:hypothetical protein